MGAKGSREAAATEKPRTEPSLNVVTATATDVPGEKAVSSAPPRKNYGAYGCAVSLAIQANAKQHQVREERERMEAAAAKAS